MLVVRASCPLEAHSQQPSAISQQSTVNKQQSTVNKQQSNARQLALKALQKIEHDRTYTDIALDRILRENTLKKSDRGLLTELVYGIVRRQRTLDTLITQLGTRPANKQPPNLRLILRLGLYQLRYLSQIPPSAAVNTSVELAKTNGLKKLSRVVNGILRQYLRVADQADPLKLPDDPIFRIGILHSFPDWMVQQWVTDWGETETEKLCQWFNHPPHIDLRVNPLQTSPEAVKNALEQAQIAVNDHSPFGLRLQGSVGNISQLPGYHEGWWTIQDRSAQLVTMLLDPQPGETIIDACAAPGGKSTHIAEWIQDQGEILACDRDTKRLQKVAENAQRLQLKSIRLCPGDSGQREDFVGKCDRLLLDAPCSGLGTLHRHPDIRWKQTPQSIQELTQRQQQLLTHTSRWVKPQGVLVYATCTLNPSENEAVIQQFLKTHPNWRIMPPEVHSPLQKWTTPQGGLKVLPHQDDQDGFFMVKLVNG